STEPAAARDDRFSAPLGVKGPSEHQSLTRNGNVRMKGLVLLSYRMSLLEKVNPPDIELFQCRLDLRAVSDTHNDGGLGMQILLRRAQRIPTGHFVNLRRQIAVVFDRQPKHKLLPDRRGRLSRGFKESNERLGKRIFRLLQFLRLQFFFADSRDLLEQFLRR